MCSPKFMLQTGKRAQSHFSVEGLYWPQDHQTAPNRFSVLVEPDNANVAEAKGPHHPVARIQKAESMNRCLII